MSKLHAALWLGDTSARLLRFEGKCRRFDPAGYQTSVYIAPGQAWAAGTETALYDDLCEAMGDVPALLVTGSGSRPDDFLHFVQDRHPDMVERIVGMQHEEEPLVERRLLALACWHFSTPVDVGRNTRARRPMRLTLPH